MPSKDVVKLATTETGAYFVSIGEAARRLGLSRATGYELVAAGRLRTVSYGRRRLVPVGEVERLAAEMTEGAA